MNILAAIIISSLLISSISFIGAILLCCGRNWADLLAQHMVSFAAGVMLAVSFFDLLPEAFEALPADSLFTWTFGGIFLFFILERFLLWFHHHDSPHEMKPTVLLVLFGDAIHNMIDGIGIAAAFLTNPTAGIITTFAMVAHEIPQEIADYTILVNGGMEKKKALVYNFLSGLTALFSSVLAYFFLSSLEGQVPYLLAFTAGMFIYIACSDLIPEMHKEFERQKSWKHTVPFVAGVVVLWLFRLVFEG